MLRIRRRRVVRGREFGKVIVPGALAALPQVSLAQGSHDLLMDGKRCEPVDHPSCHLAHFPLRSVGQYAAKAAVTSLQYQAMARRNPEAGIHYRKPLELLKRDWQAFAANLPEVARSVALPPAVWLEPGTILDPLPYQGGPLRYTPRLDDITRAWSRTAGLCRRPRPPARRARRRLDRRTAVGGATGGGAAWRTSTPGWNSGEKNDEDLRAINYAISLERLDERDAFAKEQATFAKELAEIHQSWTWRIGRLLLGPMAWARASGGRCRRALARAILPARPAPLPVGNLEIHVAHACNLRCESCSHYTNQGHQGIVSVEEAERWMIAWKRRIQPRLFAMVGGEPGLHPHLAEFVRVARRHWPAAELRLISNGFLLGGHPDLPTALRETDTCLCVSIHHPSAEYRKNCGPCGNCSTSGS